PRDGYVTRADCQVLAGGLPVTETTRAFVDFLPAHLASGWLLLSRSTVPPGLENLHVGFYAGASGRDRIALGQVLRANGARITPTASLLALLEGIDDGRFDVGVTDALLGHDAATRRGWSFAWV